MSDLVPGDDFIFMKVGVHAGETLEDILARKRKEIEDEGLSMWGYGGNSCHPSRVQDFAEDATAPIRLVMQEIKSNHFADPRRARQFSEDGGVTWRDVPAGINVLGSKYALCLSTLDDVDFTLDLAATVVPVGPQQGKRGNQYLRGHVDKACLTLLDQEAGSTVNAPVRISLSADLVQPYAVLLRD
ncbi:hypothetical protein [Cryocola sp. 340MFSha3.1]|uniref:hypothetical protein n=1 Tax=Cryocola sp. 340MFSha3.1 TaxID=1169145 RepID=UPI00037A00E6|nr:hypothetical protein [Cryocola sp. 340MFSha3.1]